MKSELRTKLEELRALYGYSQFFNEVKSMSRERIQNTERAKKVHLTPSQKQRLFDRQGGICPRCKLPLDIPARKNDGDHIDPNSTNLNCMANYALLHASCNRSKGANSVYVESKFRGETTVEMLGDEV